MWIPLFLKCMILDHNLQRMLNDSKIAQLNSERPLHQTAVFTHFLYKWMPHKRESLIELWIYRWHWGFSQFWSNINLRILVINHPNFKWRMSDHPNIQWKISDHPNIQWKISVYDTCDILEMWALLSSSLSAHALLLAAPLGHHLDLAAPIWSREKDPVYRVQILSLAPHSMPRLNSPKTSQFALMPESRMRELIVIMTESWQAVNASLGWLTLTRCCHQTGHCLFQQQTRNSLKSKT